MQKMLPGDRSSSEVWPDGSYWEDTPWGRRRGDNSSWGQLSDLTFLIENVKKIEKVKRKEKIVGRKSARQSLRRGQKQKKRDFQVKLFHIHLLIYVIIRCLWLFVLSVSAEVEYFENWNCFRERNCITKSARN